MNNTPIHADTKGSTPDIAHLAWCALIALALAQQEGKARSPMTTHTFLLNWLSTAQKQRRFSRSVSQKLEMLLNLGRQKGIAANLHDNLTVLWQAGYTPVRQDSSLLRLISSIQQLKTNKWVNDAITDEEWHIPTLLEEYCHISALLVKKSELHHHFDDEGALLGSLAFLVTGNTATPLATFKDAGLSARVEKQHENWGMLILEPDDRS
ncbi:hypothetical protein DLP14_14745 [Salmonella enterica]|nr:hypothetical protein [Salmonella enterica]EMD7797660.1 DUF2913 family protein [Salmonella enterica]